MSRYNSEQVQLRLLREPRETHTRVKSGTGRICRLCRKPIRHGEKYVTNGGKCNLVAHEECLEVSRWAR